MSLQTPVGIQSFPRYYTPRPRVEGGEPVFSGSLIFSKQQQATPQFKALKTAVEEAAKARFGAKMNDSKFRAKLRLPFRDCSEKDYNGYDIPGGVFISAWSKNRPGVVDAHRNEIHTPEDVYAGQLARFAVNAFAYDVSGNVGVSFGLNAVQICADGERIDGRKKAQEEFLDYETADAEPF